MLAWLQWMTRNSQLTAWSGLLQSLEARFVPSTYEDPSRTLFKLMQHSSVNDYLSDFETLANYIIGLPATLPSKLFHLRFASEDSLRGSSITTSHINSGGSSGSAVGRET